MDISDNIKSIIEENGQSLPWLAKQAGVTRSGLYKMLDSNVFRTDTLGLIAKALNVPVTTLIEGKRAKEEKSPLTNSSEMTLTLLRTFMEAKKIEWYLQKAEKDDSIDKHSALTAVEKMIERLLEIHLETPYQDAKTDEERALLFLDAIKETPLAGQYEVAEGKLQKVKLKTPKGTKKG